MTTAAVSAATGVQLGQTQFDRVAARIATNPDSADSVSLSADAAGLLQAKNLIETNLSALRVADNIEKSTLSLLA